jgi:hypothetical protein
LRDLSATVYEGYESPFVNNIEAHPWLYTESGFSFIDPHLIQWAKVETVFCFGPFNAEQELWSIEGGKYDAVCIIRSGGWPMDAGGWVGPPYSDTGKMFVHETHLLSPLGLFRSTAGRCLIETKLADREEELPLFQNRLKNGLAIESRDARWTVYRRGAVKDGNSELDRFRVSGDTSWKGILAEWRLARNEIEMPETCVYPLWKEVFGRATLPFDASERREVLKDAYRELADYVSRWERLSLR